MTAILAAKWVAFLPAFVKKSLEGRHNLQIIIRNSGWLFIDKFVRMGVGLIIGVLVARCLGPEQFGFLNYALAFVTLFSAISSFGIDELIIKNLIVSPEKENAILGSALLLKLIGSFITIITSMLFIRYTNSFNDNMNYIVFILSSCYVFQSFFIIDCYFKSKQLVHYPIYVFLISFTIVSILKIYLIYVKSGVIGFVFAIFAEVVINAVLLVFLYITYKKQLLSWKIDFEILVDTTRKGLPMIFALIANSMYMRIDQVMIGEMLGQKAVGLYSSSVKISESWYVLLTIISTVIFPALVKAKAVSEDYYYDMISKVIAVNVAISLFFIFIFNVFSESLIVLLFGSSYRDASTSLAILSWTGIVFAFGGIWGSWIIIENMQKWCMINIALAAIINIILNFLLIPRFGMNGSAIATVIANIMALCIVGTMDRKLMRMNKIFVCSLSPSILLKLIRQFTKTNY